MKTRESLESALRSSLPLVRCDACRTIAGHGGAEARATVELLTAALADLDGNVRWYARAALERLGEKT